MFQPYAARPGAHATLHWLREGALWLVHMGLFATLLWLSARLSRESPPIEAKKCSPAEPRGCQLGPAPKPVPVDRTAQTYPPASTRCPLPSTRDVFGSDIGPWSDTIPYSAATMLQPVLLSGKKIEPTPEAIAARVQGLMIVKCTITCQGEVRNCRTIKALPYMEEAVLSALQSRRYRPVEYQGTPISVSYLFNIKINWP